MVHSFKGKMSRNWLRYGLNCRTETTSPFVLSKCCYRVNFVGSGSFRTGTLKIFACLLLIYILKFKSAFYPRSAIRAAAELLLTYTATIFITTINIALAINEPLLSLRYPLCHDKDKRLSCRLLCFRNVAIELISLAAEDGRSVSSTCEGRTSLTTL